MTKRKLSSDEEKLCKRAIEQLKKRRNIIQPKIKYYDYLISQGLRISFEEELDKAMNTKKEINQETFEIDMKINVLQCQIQDGIEVIKEKKKFCLKCGQEEKCQK